MKTLRIALIGAGYIADYHARGLLKVSHVEIAAVVSGQLANAQKFAQKYGIEKAYSTISSVVEDPSVDAVIISTPNAYHGPYAIEFMKGKKDVFLEKPMAMDAEEGKQIAEISAKYDQLVMVGHMWRFDEDTNYLKQAIENDKIGRIYKTKGYGIHENWGPAGWFTKKELAGGGALADMGVHAIDTVRYLLGDPFPASVYARISTHFGDYEVDDTGILVISWDNGTESIIESGWWQPHMDGPEASTGLFGKKGYASLFPTYLKLKKGVESSEIITPELPQREEHCDQKIYSAQMAYFVECVRTRTQPVPGLSEGLVVLKIVDAAFESSRSGEAIQVDKI